MSTVKKPLPKRILFLDVDGVLNSMWSFRNIGRSWPHSDSKKTEATYKTNWIPRAVEIIQKLVNHDEFYIVMSSTWRKFEDNAFFAKHLGLPLDRFLGNTPEGIPANGRLGVEYVIRGLEIEHWFKEAIKNKKIDPNANYIILDDDSDMTFEQKKNQFVKTQFATYTGKDDESHGLNWDHYEIVKTYMSQWPENSGSQANK
jgi:histidinol phosphatase-like enzyme